MAIHLPLVLNDGKFSQLPTGDTIAGSGVPDSVRVRFHLNSLAAFDEVADITYLDAGTRNERIDTVTLSSTLFPQTDIVKTVSYLDAGLMNERIEKIEYVGAVFSPDSLRKVFVYSDDGIRKRLDGYFYELF